MSVCVAIPCANKHIPFLNESINSVLTQTYKVNRISVCVSGTNKCPKDNRVNIKCFSKSMYAGECRNIASSFCKEKFVSFLDADDLMMPYAVERMVSLMTSNNATVGLHDYHRYNDKILSGPELIPFYRNQLPPLKKDAHFGHVTVRKDNMINQRKYMKRGQDSQFVLDLMKRGEKIVYTPEKLTVYNKKIVAKQLSYEKNYEKINFEKIFKNSGKQIKEAITEGKKIIPKSLNCLEWSMATYASHLGCHSVTEFVYSKDLPVEKKRTNEKKWCERSTVCPSSRIYLGIEYLGIFRPSAYELIISINVFEHVTNPNDAFSSMIKSLTPGGWLIMTVPFFEISNGKPQDYYRFTYHTLWTYAKNNSMCVHQIGGHNYIQKNIYTLSKLVAQKKPCIETENIE